MDPITGVMVGSMVISSLAQAYNAAKQRGDDKSKLDQIREMFDKVKPPDYDVSIDAPPEQHKEALAQPQFSGPMSAPKFNLDALKPEEMQQIGRLSPEVAPYIAEAAPKQIEQTADMKTGREAQMNALRQYQNIGAGGFDPQQAQAMSQASRQSQADAQSRSASTMQDFARRGMAGSGMELAAKLGGNASAMDRDAQMQQSAAADAYKNRLMALSQGANIGSQIGQEDQSLQGRNADIINSFNQRASRNQQQWQNDRAQGINSANQYNLGVGQNIANQNVQGRNQAQQQHQGRIDALTKYGANFAQGERDRTDSNQKYAYNNAAQERAYQNQLAADKSSWQFGQKKYANDLMSQKFGNQMQQASGQAGMMNSQIAQGQQATRDQNAAIGGLGQAGMMAGMMYQNSADKTAATQAGYGQQRAKDRSAFAQSHYNKTGQLPGDDTMNDWDSMYGGGG